MKDVGQILMSGMVMRYHTTGMLAKQSIAEHGWNVAMFVLYIEPDARIELLKAALWHDCHELETGDIPAPAKKHLNNITELERQWDVEQGISVALTDAEKDILKAADILDGLWHCAVRYKCGEKHAAVLSSRWYGYLTESVGLLELPGVNDMAYQLYVETLEMR